MKNQILLITLSLLVLITFSNCSNESSINSEKTVIKSSIININLKSEVENLVDLHCKAINVLRKVDKGDRTALSRSNAYRKEADKIARDLQNKYSSPDEQEEYTKAYQNALVNCPSVK
jgi:hypothetical protein